MNCPVKTNKFYTNLLTHFNETTVNNEDIKSFEIWMKTSNPDHNTPFMNWYGNGKVDTFNNPVLVDNLYYQNEQGQKILVDELLNTIDFTDAEKLQELHDKIDNIVKDLKKKSDKYYNEYDKIVHEVQDVITKFGVIYGKTNNEVYNTKIKDLQDSLAKSIENNETERAIGLFVRNAIREITDSLQKFNEMVDSNEVTVKKLRTFNTYLSAYDILEEIDVLLNKDKNYELLNKDSKLRGVTKEGLTQAIKDKNTLKDRYNKLLKEFIAEGLAEYSKFNNKESFMTLLENANQDINSFELWLDFMGDTEDGVTSVLAKIFDSKNRETMRKQEHFSKEFFSLLDKHFKDSKDLDPKKLFKDYLEHDGKGRETGYLISKYKMGEFDKEFKEKQAAYKSIEDINSPEYKAKKREFYDWLNANTEKPYTDEYYEIINSLTKAAKDARKVIFDKMNTIKNKYPKKVQNYTEADKKLLDAYKRELDQLGELVDEDGNYKENLSQADLDIIESIKSYKINYAKAHTFKLDLAGFKIARRRAEEELSEEGFAEWLKNNTETVNGKVSANNKWKKPIVKVAYINPKFEVNHKGYAIPNDKWLNPEYNKIKNDEVYQYMDKLYKEQQLRVPPHERLGYQLPYMRKSGTIERLYDKTKEEGVKKVGTVVKESFLDQLKYREGDTTRGIYDVTGNPVQFIPVNYTAKVPVEEMSFDLAKLFTHFNYTTLNYNAMNDILDFALGVKELVEKRGYTRVDNMFQPILNQITWRNEDGVLKNLNEQKQFIEGKTSNVAKQLDIFLQMNVFGVKDKDLGYIDLGLKRYDKAKLVQMVNNYTSYSLLGLNALAANVNFLQGNIQNIIEAGAGEFFGLKNYFKSGKIYSKNMVGILGDIGERSPKNIITLLNRKFDTLGKYDEELNNSSNNTRFKKLLNSSSVFFMTNLGEHMMQSRVMLSMLDAKIPLDIDGNTIEGLNSMLDAFTEKNGELVLDPRVANFDIKSEDTFSRELQTVIRRTHGNYNSMTAVAWQQHAVMRMVGAMRKWIRGTYMKRWARRRKNEFLESETEGYYVTTRKFMFKLIKDMKQLKWSLLSSDWENLENFQKANVRRMLGEVASILVLLTTVMLFTKDGDDDDDEEYDNVYLAYLATRLMNEQLFYTNLLDTLKILKSPAASMTITEDMLRLSYRLVSLNAGEEYVSGRRKGEYKIKKQIEDIVPFYKQIDRLSSEGLKDQLTWFNMK